MVSHRPVECSVEKTRHLDSTKIALFRIFVYYRRMVDRIINSIPFAENSFALFLENTSSPLATLLFLLDLKRRLRVCSEEHTSNLLRAIARRNTVTNLTTAFVHYLTPGTAWHTSVGSIISLLNKTCSPLELILRPSSRDSGDDARAREE
jgi:hypothetical protein